MGDLVRIHTESSPVGALLIKSRLESEDIPVFLKGEVEGPYRFGPVHLWVPADLEVQARVVLAEILGGALALPDDEDVPEETDETLNTD